MMETIMDEETAIAMKVSSTPAVEGREMAAMKAPETRPVGAGKASAVKASAAEMPTTKMASPSAS